MCDVHMLMCDIVGLIKYGMHHMGCGHALKVCAWTLLLQWNFRQGAYARTRQSTCKVTWHVSAMIPEANLSDAL
jgi:hypothetical protein